MTDEPPAAGDLLLHLGTYDRLGGEGLYPLRLGADDLLRLGEPCGAIRNGSFGTFGRRAGIHYFVNEQQDGTVGAYRLEPAGWRKLAEAPTGGAAPCFVALDPTETLLAVANYGSGSIALLSLAPSTGAFSGPLMRHRNRGSGPDVDRQSGPHAHCVRFSPDGRWLFSVDLGTDQILAFELPIGEASEPRIAYSAPRGSGPRHLLLHPDGDRAFLVSELASTIMLLERTGGTFRCVQQESTLPPGFAGRSLGGHLALNAAGDRLYVSNRGHDSLAVFAVNARGLTLLQHIDSGGVSPRFFLVMEDRERLVLANEEDGTVALFAIRPDGLLMPLSNELRVPGAAFIAR